MTLAGSVGGKAFACRGTKAAWSWRRGRLRRRRSGHRHGRRGASSLRRPATAIPVRTCRPTKGMTRARAVGAPPRASARLPLRARPRPRPRRVRRCTWRRARRKGARAVASAHGARRVRVLLRHLVAEWRVQPKTEAWEQILDESLAGFEERRRPRSGRRHLGRHVAEPGSVERLVHLGTMLLTTITTRRGSIPLRRRSSPAIAAFRAWRFSRSCSLSIGFSERSS